MVHSDAWSDVELAAAVVAYRLMQGYEASGVGYSKADVRRGVVTTLMQGRTESAYEYRLQNISAVLERMGEPCLKGYRPAANVGAEVAERLERILSVIHP